MHRKQLRGALFAASLAITTCGIVVACGSFSGSDATGNRGPDDATAATDAPLNEIADAGAALDATTQDNDAGSSTMDATPPSACTVDAAAIAFCDSFEVPGAFACGGGWSPVKGSGTVITGGAHGGSSFCRFCPTSSLAELDQRFTLTSTNSYGMSAWVRAGPRPDASTTEEGTTQFFAYLDGGQIERTDVTFVLSDKWTMVQSSVMDSGLGTSELINFYAEPFGANVGECIDIDDVVVVRGK